MNLENRGNGSWRVTISDGYAPDGSKRRFQRTIHVDPSKTIKAQRREAEKQAALIEADYQRKLVLMGNKITIEALAEEYLQDRVERRRLKESTAKQYRDLLYWRIIPELGKEYVQDLTARDISGFYRKLKTAPARSGRSKTGKLSGTTQHQYHTQLHALLKYAVTMGYIAVNPADQVEAPRKDTKSAQCLELADVARLLTALDGLDDPQWRLFFYMSLYTGMRAGEIVALNWEDIKGNVLSVRASAVKIKGQGTARADRPKTKAGIRSIILPDVIMKQLSAHRREQLAYRLPFGSAWPEPDAVFTSDDGRRMSLDSPTHKFQKILKANNLPHITLHGLRHTAASAMIAQGISVTDIAKQLGHAQTSTTLDIYAHAFAEANARAAKAVESAYDLARDQLKQA